MAATNLEAKVLRSNSRNGAKRIGGVENLPGTGTDQAPAFLSDPRHSMSPRLERKTGGKRDECSQPPAGRVRSQAGVPVLSASFARQAVQWIQPVTARRWCAFRTERVSALPVNVKPMYRPTATGTLATRGFVRSVGQLGVV
ncbi:MAG: hypothetical protein AB7K24_15195 [Gemmataceae bacterium]